LKHSDEDEDEDDSLDDSEMLQHLASLNFANSILSLISHSDAFTLLMRLMNRFDSQSFPTIVLFEEAMQDSVILEV
jgi:hypothetical protein